MDALDRLKAALADRYTVERELGAGGMATVYLARARTRFAAKPGRSFGTISAVPLGVFLAR